MPPGTSWEPGGEPGRHQGPGQAGLEFRASNRLLGEENNPLTVYRGLPVPGYGQYIQLKLSVRTCWLPVTETQLEPSMN